MACRIPAVFTEATLTILTGHQIRLLHQIRGEAHPVSPPPIIHTTAIRNELLMVKTVPPPFRVRLPAVLILPWKWSSDSLNDPFPLYEAHRWYPYSLTIIPLYLDPRVQRTRSTLRLTHTIHPIWRPHLGRLSMKISWLSLNRPFLLHHLSHQAIKCNIITTTHNNSCQPEAR